MTLQETLQAYQNAGIKEAVIKENHYPSINKKTFSAYPVKSELFTIDEYTAYVFRVKLKNTVS